MHDNEKRHVKKFTQVNYFEKCGYIIRFMTYGKKTTLEDIVLG